MPLPNLFCRLQPARIEPTKALRKARLRETLLRETHAMRLYGAYNDNLDDANKRGNHYSLRRRDTMLVSLFITTPNNAMCQYRAINVFWMIPINVGLPHEKSPSVAARGSIFVSWVKYTLVVIWFIGFT